MAEAATNRGRKSSRDRRHGPAGSYTSTGWLAPLDGGRGAAPAGDRNGRREGRLYVSIDKGPSQEVAIKEKIDMGVGTALIACGIFRHELESVLPAEKGIAVHWLDAALHADAERMKAALDHAVADHQARSTDRIGFLFGNGCHPDIDSVAEACGSCIPRVNNCIQAMIGPQRTKALEADRTMVITPGWITAWPDIMKGLGWDAVDVRINLGRYDRIVLIDGGVAPVSDETILAFYDLVQVPVEIEPTDLSYFRNLVNHILEDPLGGR